MPELLENKKSFDDFTGGPQLSVVHFSADWAEQCTQINDLLDLLSKHSDYSKVKFARCLAEDLSDVALQNKIEAVPTVVLYKSGKTIDRIDGADTSKITATIKQYSSESGPGKTKSAGDATKHQSLEDRLKALINKSKVMLFMKGDRNTPRCGFSRQIIEILNGTGVTYETFDILTDEEVRQGLKTYSDWPTYPQLYVKGELIGGLDIIKEMQAAGEFMAALNV